MGQLSLTNGNEILKTKKFRDRKSFISALRPISCRSFIFVAGIGLSSLLTLRSAQANTMTCFSQVESEAPSRMGEKRLEQVIAERVRELARRQADLSRHALKVRQNVEKGMSEGQKFGELYGSAHRVASPRGRWQGVKDALASLNWFGRKQKVRPVQSLSQSVLQVRSALSGDEAAYLKTVSEIDRLSQEFEALALAALSFPQLSSSRSLALGAVAAIGEIRAHLDITGMNAQAVETVLRGQIAHLSQVHSCVTASLCKGQSISVITRSIPRGKVFSTSPIKRYYNPNYLPFESVKFAGIDESGYIRVHPHEPYGETKEFRVLPAEIIRHHAVVRLRSGESHVARFQFALDLQYADGLLGTLDGLLPDHDHLLIRKSFDKKGSEKVHGYQRVDPAGLAAVWSTSIGSDFRVPDLDQPNWWKGLQSIEAGLAVLGYDLRRIDAPQLDLIGENEVAIYASFERGHLKQVRLIDRAELAYRPSKNKTSPVVIRTLNLDVPLAWAPDFSD
jgi:uncharacterized protein (DUF934 family)